MAAPNDERRGLPGYEGYLNDRSLSVAQLLKDAGYHTYMAGKWTWAASSPTPATPVLLGTAGRAPVQWGFEKSFALMGGAASNHDCHGDGLRRGTTENGAYIQPGQPGQPGTGTYSTDFYTQRLISYIDANKGTASRSSRTPRTRRRTGRCRCPDPWLNKYKGRYDAGYEADPRRAHREAEGTRASSRRTSPRTPPDPETAGRRRRPPPTSGTASAKYINAVNGPADGLRGLRCPARVSEEVGQPDRRSRRRPRRATWRSTPAWSRTSTTTSAVLIQHLKDIGEYENTLIVFQSDNGAEGWPIASAATDRKATDEANAADAVYPTLGTDNGLTSAQRLQYGIRWAEVSATPFRQTKGHFGEGGVGTPLMLHAEPGEGHWATSVRSRTSST